MKHKNSTKSEKQYVRAIVHNLSLQRMTDQEIVDYLHNEKKIDIARSTNTGIRNRIEKEAEKWYIELRDSRHKYIAIYKERIDSLSSYQRKLQDIIEFYRHDHLYPDTVIKAIAELHRIEMSIFNLWKELPQLSNRVESSNYNQKNAITNSKYYRLGVFVNDCNCHSIVSHFQCRYCLTTWCPKDRDKKQDWCPNPECSEGIKGNHFAPYDEDYTWVKCDKCERYFRTPEVLAIHPCYGNSVQNDG